MERTARRMRRTAGVNLSSLIWNGAVLMLVTRTVAIDFTRSEDSLGNLDIYEVCNICIYMYWSQWLIVDQSIKKKKSTEEYIMYHHLKLLLNFPLVTRLKLNPPRSKPSWRR